jgi:hypothetical protein
MYCLQNIISMFWCEWKGSFSIDQSEIEIGQKDENKKERERNNVTDIKKETDFKQLEGR